MTATMESIEHTGPRDEDNPESRSDIPQTAAAIGTTVVTEVLPRPQFDPFTTAPKGQRCESILLQVVD